MKTFKVLIAGGRDFNDFKMLSARLDGLLKEKVLTHKIIIVSGKATGADSLGEKYAKQRGFEVEEYPADWKNLDVKGVVIRSNAYGKYNAVAGQMRNKLMAVACDVGVLFWDGLSTGTSNMRGLLSEARKPCRLYNY